MLTTTCVNIKRNIRLGLSAMLALSLLCGSLATAAQAAPSVPTRAGQQYLEALGPDGTYQPVYVKGMNLSVALPGHHPSEFPHDEQVYRDWLKQIADMNCNVIRLYTILPPEVYSALAYHNKTYPEQRLWLIQGVWVEPPPTGDFLDQAFMDEVEMNIRHAVDLVHGNASFEDRPGWTGGKYKTDVSPYLLAWLIGREWEPNDIQVFQKVHPEYTTYHGTLVSCYDAQPIECWLARICDYAVTQEQASYSVQHPVTFSSWPPTDPLSHVSESNIEDDTALAQMTEQQRVDVFSSDAVNISVTHFTAEREFLAGLYASYHVYPYWPDFIDNEPSYGRGLDRFGPSNYAAYLAELKTQYPTMPLLIAEYGLPNGPLPAHLQHQGWNHGGLSEEEVAEALPRLSYAIRDTGCAGGIVFAWIDEWFKKVWLWAEFYDPWDDRRMWFNFLDPEENFGMVALLPGADGPTCTLSGNADEWAAATEVSGSAAQSTASAPVASSVKLMHDEGYLYVRVQLANFEDWDFAETALYLGLDVLDPARGNTAWPAPLSLESDWGLEEVVVFAAGAARVYQSESFRFWEPYLVPYSSQPEIGEVQPHILGVEDNRRGWFEPAIETNRRRVGRDGRIYPSRYWELNPLPKGNLTGGTHYNSQTLWNVDPATGVLEIRLPWILLGFVGPHQMRVIQAAEDYSNSSEVSTGVGVAVVLGAADGSMLSAWPGLADEVVTTSAGGRYTWPEWTVEEIKYHARFKPVYYSLQEAFKRIDREPPVKLPEPAPEPPPAPPAIEEPPAAPEPPAEPAPSRPEPTPVIPVD